jgi:hypothetical protein
MLQNPIQFQSGLSLSAFHERAGTDAQCAARLLEARWRLKRRFGLAALVERLVVACASTIPSPGARLRLRVRFRIRGSRRVGCHRIVKAPSHSSKGRNINYCGGGVGVGAGGRGRRTRDRTNHEAHSLRFSSTRTTPMHRHAVVIPLLAAALVGAAVPLAASEGEGHDLIGLMGRLQYFAHKLGLAVSAKNQALEGFYVHEVHETVERIQGIDQAEGLEVGKLARSNLVPALKALEEAIAVGNQAGIDDAYDGLLTACNACHRAAERPYIHIVRRTDNPYMQDFGPRP